MSSLPLNRDKQLNGPSLARKHPERVVEALLRSTRDPNSSRQSGKAKGNVTKRTVTAESILMPSPVGMTGVVFYSRRDGNEGHS